MKSKKATGGHLSVLYEQVSHETVLQRSIKDPLLLTILGTAFGLAVLVVGIAFVWGSGPVMAEIPWFISMVASFTSLASLCVAFLALGRYQVLRDPVSFWVGLGFASLAIGQFFYVLAWPGLLPGGGALIARLPNTSAFITALNLTIFGGFILAAVLLSRPGKQALLRRRWLSVVAAWLSFYTLIFVVVVSSERYLPVLIRSNGTFTPLLSGLVVFLLLLFAAGSFLSIRYYLHSRDALAGYVAFAQMTLVFLILMSIIGGKRYDLWWYLQRVIGVSGYLIVLFGLLSEYVRLLQRESEGRLMLEAVSQALKERNERLQESEERYRGLFETMQEGLVVAEVITDEMGNPVDYRYLDVNPVTERQFGLSRDQFVGHTYTEVIPDYDPEWITILGNVALTGKPVSLEKYGKFTGLWFHCQAYSPRPGLVVNILTDITERKRAEAALQKHTAELEHANRDLQNFTVMTSHDLQEPLRKIEALGDTVLKGASGLDEHLLDRIQRMRKSAQQMRKMVDGLLQLALLSTDAQSFQPVDLHQITFEILAEKKDRIQQLGGVVEVNELPVIEADPLQMRKLLQHLIENSLKFQPPGGKPWIKMSSKPIASRSVQILIEDNGIGFDEAHAGHLFEPFERLVGKNQPQYDGIGMGLAICRWIVERHSGEITASSKIGQGATFIVTLPNRQRIGARN